MISVIVMLRSFFSCCFISSVLQIVIVWLIVGFVNCFICVFVMLYSVLVCNSYLLLVSHFGICLNEKLNINAINQIKLKPVINHTLTLTHTHQVKLCVYGESNYNQSPNFRRQTLGRSPGTASTHLRAELRLLLFAARIDSAYFSTGTDLMIWRTTILLSFVGWSN